MKTIIGNNLEFFLPDWPILYGEMDQTAYTLFSSFNQLQSLLPYLHICNSNLELKILLLRAYHEFLDSHPASADERGRFFSTHLHD